MSERTTWKSKISEFDTDECLHCGEEVRINTDEEDHDANIPDGIAVTIGTGGDMTIDEKGYPSLNYRVPEIVVKWFPSDNTSVTTELQYMCPECAKSIYDYSK